MKNDFSNWTDIEIWKAFKQGSDPAFAHIYHHYSASLFSYGMHISRDGDLVKDCMQNLFIELWDSRQNLTDTGSIKFYLFTCLKRSIVDHLVAKNKYTTLEEVIENYDFEITHSHEFELLASQASQEQKEKLLLGINQLTKRQKEAIYLLYYNNLSHQEAASMMSLKVTAVYNLVYQALVTLKKTVSRVGLFILWAELMKF